MNLAPRQKRVIDVGQKIGGEKYDPTKVFEVMEEGCETVRITLQTACTVVLPIDGRRLTRYRLILIVFPCSPFREESVGFLDLVLASSRDCRLYRRTIYENHRIPF